MKHLILLFVLIPSVCMSQIEMIQPLSFGTIVVGKNNEVSYIEVSPLGVTQAHNHIWLIEEGQNAEFLVTNLPPYREINVQIDILTPTAKSNFHDTEQFVVDSVAAFPSPITADSVGQAKIYVGAVLKTTGNNQTYLNTEYMANFRITLNY
ncbi:DUF4402 domain-containing protein [Catenovulum sp. 2E275]|uniref:DUF4402 domain-containing protein n=1 Tax=Catenovulum sp. 2E275 TaxID=2980497 RepID=UPI0021D06DF6|nr:DUF4402 domain-containing protein [Catenovulum sp. 2E275]MCU4677440.1 DUF4402 domain-containing protein [Catenovulum sp. 2E275]